MGMRPEDFYTLTYTECALMMEGFSTRRRTAAQNQRTLTAWAVAWLLAPHTAEGKKPLTPDELLGKKQRKPREPEKFGTPEELHRIVRGY